MTDAQRKESVLLYFAEEFSTNKAEQFIEQELNFFAGDFKEIHVFVFNNNLKDCKYPLAANVKLIDFDLYLGYNRLAFLAKHFLTVLGIFRWQLRHSPNHASYLKKKIYYFNSLLHNSNAALRLNLFIQKNYKQGSYFTYSFWFNRWLFVLSLAKHFKPSVVSKIITRTHGGDYDETQTKTFFPFRSFQMSKVDVIAPVSQYGENYIRNKYKNYSGKLKHAYLGVPDRGLNEAKGSQVFQLVTCSSLIPLKRVHLVIEILKHIELPLKWTHFGDGPLRKEVQELASYLPKNITVEFKGHIPNKEFLSYIKTNPVDLFVNVSESEGLPVSLMEAISFGIPILATEVGGVAEIANQSTGYLVPKDLSTEVVAATITQHFQKPTAEVQALRSSAREFYLQNFNSDTNYLKFIKENF